MPRRPAIPYDPDRHILIRDWNNARDYDYSSLLFFLRQASVEIITVVNPYAAALRKSFPGGRHYSESYSPTSRAISVLHDPALAEYEAARGRTPIRRKIRVAWKALADGGYAVDVDASPALGRRDTKFILRPPTLAMTASTMTVKASSFDWQPPILLSPPDDEGIATLTIYGNHHVGSSTLTINGLAVSLTVVPHTISELPGGWRWGRWQTQLGVAGVRTILGAAAPEPPQDVQSASRAEAAAPAEAETPSATVRFKRRGAFAVLRSAQDLPKHFNRPRFRPALVIRFDRKEMKAWGDRSIEGSHLNANGVRIGPFHPTTGSRRYKAKLDASQISALVKPAHPVRPSPRGAMPLKTIVAAQLRQVSAQDVIDAWSDLECGISPVCFDRQYRALPLDTWRRIVEESPDLASEPYVAEFRDCDDFVWRAKGGIGTTYAVNGIGAVLSTSARHAFVAVLVAEDDDEIGIRFIEPQSRQWVIVDSAPHYSLDSGTVIF